MKRLVGVLAVAAVMTWAAPAWADCCAGGGECPMMKQQAEQKESMCPVTNKVLEKSKFLLEHADEIGLNEEQVRTIKAIKHDAKKAAVQQEADMKLFELDVNAKMSEPKLDVDGLNAMFDGAAAGMATGAKGMVAQYAKLKATLSDDQAAKAKKLWSAKP